MVRNIYCLHVGKQSTGFFESFSHFAHIADNHDLIHLAIRETVECKMQQFDLFVYVSDESEFH